MGHNAKWCKLWCKVSINSVEDCSFLVKGTSKLCWRDHKNNWRNAVFRKNVWKYEKYMKGIHFIISIFDSLGNELEALITAYVDAHTESCKEWSEGVAHTLRLRVAISCFYAIFSNLAYLVNRYGKLHMFYQDWLNIPFSKCGVQTATKWLPNSFLYLQSFEILSATHFFL